MRGPTFQLEFPLALELLKMVAPLTPIGFGAEGSNVENLPYSLYRPPCQSNRSPSVMFRFLVSLMSSLPQNDRYFILGMYLNGTENPALLTWPNMKEANSFPVIPAFRPAPFGP